jgi:hypothetical protein
MASADIKTIVIQSASSQVEDVDKNVRTKEDGSQTDFRSDYLRLFPEDVPLFHQLNVSLLTFFNLLLTYLR